MTMNETAAGRLHSEINITPMIDVLLVLLIIFMVIVPAISRGEATVTPHHAPVPAPKESDAVVLEVLRGSAGEASFRINQQAISWAELPARLGAIYARRAQPVLFVKADDRLSFSRVAEVIDVSHAAGVDRVCLMSPNVASL